MSDSEIWLLGVDGGGSKTEAWLINREDYLRGLPAFQGLAGPSNPRAVGMDGATRQILKAIEAAHSQVASRTNEVHAACLAIAGGDRVDIQKQLDQWAREQCLASRVTVCNDAEPILARTPRRIGVALIAGTGSFAYGRNEQGDVHRAGGWGFRFGDEGSGYAIAVAGITAALRFADGRSDATQLLPALLDHFGAATPRELLPHLYDSRMERESIARLSELVLNLAQAGDAVALQIRHRAATELCQLVLAVQQTLQLPANSLPVAIAGGVLLHSPELKGDLIEKLTTANVACDLISVPHPVAGAVTLASDLVAAHP